MFFVIFVFSAFITYCLYAEEIKSAEIPFKKLVFEDEREIVSIEGIIYFAGDERVFIKVTKPINQIVIFANLTNTFYYPDEKTAIIMTYREPNISTMKMQFEVFARDDLGLGEAGYKLENTYKSNNILVGIWIPPERLKRQSGKVEIGRGKKVLNL
ncbi:MAG: hypothetical protein ACP5QT_00615 [Brevinematia bacterium]